MEPQTSQTETKDAEKKLKIMIKAGDEDGQVCETTRLSEDGDGWRHMRRTLSAKREKER